MKLINEICQDLKTAAEELAAGEINKTEFNLKLDLLAVRIDRLEINFTDTRIKSDLHEKTKGNVQDVFQQLLYQRKYKATEELTELQRPGTPTRTFNHRIRRLLAAKLYFRQLESVIKRNMLAHNENDLEYFKSHTIQLFTERIDKDE